MNIIVLRDTYRQILRVPEEGELTLAPDMAVFLKDGVLHYRSTNGSAILGQEGVSLGEVVLYPQPKTLKRYDLEGLERVVIGADPSSDLLVEDSSVLLLLNRQATGSWILECLGKSIYLNNRLSTETVALPFGAELAFESVQIKVFPKELWVSGSVHQGRLLAVATSVYSYYSDYPDYHRSPRLIYRPNEDKVTVNAPPPEPNKPRNELLRMLVPPMVMVGVIVLISIFQPRGLYIFMSVAMGVTTGIFSVQNYFRNKRDYKKSLVDRIVAYQAYLKDKSIQLTALAKEQRFGQFYHYPDADQRDNLAQELSHRIYEKRLTDADFLNYRLGLGEVPTSYALSYSQAERSGVKDPLEVEGFTLYEDHKTLKDLPVAAQLTQGPVGYVGERALVLDQLQLLVHQLVLFHSYHDLQLIVVMPEEERSQWEWLRWLPHAKLRGLNLRGFIDNQRTRDQVLGSLNQILKQRQLDLDAAGSNQTLTFSPHYVVLITDETLVQDHVIMEYFSGDPSPLGCHLIFVQEVMRALSENVQTVVRIKDQDTGELVMDQGELKEQLLTLDHFPESYDKERLSRRLAPLNHLETLKSSIPESVSFLELYGAERVGDLGILSRWSSHHAYQSLSVPLGLRGQEDTVQLDLHEKAHGPHGLIAGTTGSGKSELIQSYILSLAVNFHPHEVAFLLIDYKGGGMANLFADLPHVLGTITNLDGNQTARAMASIRAENQRRQRLFAQHGVNHIHAYQKKVRQGEAKEPLPHLIIISDEFAELKSEQPDFITELVSTARVGRSLGVNLILATQKPAGVVNDQIWSNSNFRIALKVADKADSQEMLHTADAATITRSGRAYLQVGNNEVYELFQSAWSGADYQPDKEEQGIADQTIYRINELGQYEALNPDLSGLDEAELIQEVPTELDAVVGHIQQLVQQEHIAPLAQPWLPPLKERICLSDLMEGKQSPYDAVFGIVDIPDEQAQIPAVYNPVKQGNLLLLAQPGMGKSTFLQTLTISLATQHSPEEVQFYLLDFGTNGLLPLHNLPHVADLIVSDDDEKIGKFVTRMEELVAERKAFLKNEGAANSTMYRDLGHTYPQVLIVFDNYDGAKDTPYYEDIDRTIQMLARDGSAVGITVIMTAGRMSALRGGLMATMRERLVLKLTDASESRTFVGHHTYTLDDIPGRGLLKMEKPEVFQTALPATGKTNQEVLIALQERVKALDEGWTGPRPESIPLVPEVLNLDNYRSRQDVVFASETGQLPVGLSTDKVDNVALPLSQLKHIAYVSDDDNHMQTITQHLVAVTTMVSESSVMLYDSNGRYEYLSDKVKTYVSDESDMITRLAQLIMEIERRETPGETYKNWFGIIPDFESFVAQSQMSLEQLQTIFDRGTKVHMYLLAGGTPNYMLYNVNTLPKYYRQNVSHFLVGMRMSDQTFLPKTYNSKEPYLPLDMVYLHNRRKERLLKITQTTQL